MKNIRDHLKTMLDTDDLSGATPSSELRDILISGYKVAIQAVETNPLKVEGKVKGEQQWKKLEKDCDNKKLGTTFKEKVMRKIGRDLPFDIRVVVNKVREINENPIPNSFSGRGRESIISKVVFDVIKNKEYTVYDFHSILVKYKEDVDLTALHSEEDGYNMLHAIIVFNRLPLLLTLVHLKLWRSMMQESVPFNSPSSFRGHTPKQIGESKRAKRFRDEVANHERLVNSMSKFLRACHDGDKDLAMKHLRQQQQIIHERDSMKNNCLYWAIVSGNLDLLKYLLDQGAEYNNLNENKENLLHVACMLGHSQFINVLMTRCKMDVTASCSGKRTPLERVAENGDVESLKELLKCGVLLTSCVLPFAAANGRQPFIK